MTRIAVVDHGAGNLVSITQGLQRVGAETVLAAGPHQLDDADGVVLPGVGTPGAAMKRLQQAGFVEPLVGWPGPLLGICVGLQLFFDASSEDDSACLGLMAGRVERLRETPRLPHIGWNDVLITAQDPLWEGLPDHPTFYFVHSYAPAPPDPGLVIGEAGYGPRFCVAVRDGRRVGVQFHPERSGANGLRVLSNFLAECRTGSEAR
ncbi:MAG: imidazole glycerol phosphate synthase subunit HisH [Acidimicrobiia bacterium]|nr:imidazole glycerol phosphate synthase subunit HisH [Acidimicrobiia bacterium]